MSATNLTKNLKLSQFVASDKPSWLGDVNGDNKKIDDGYGVLAGEISKANDTASSAKSQSDANTQTLTNVNSELEDYGNRITALEAGGGTEQLEQRVNTLGTDVEALQTRADTFEENISQNGTDITALNGRVDTIEPKVKTNADNITSLQTSNTTVLTEIQSLKTINTEHGKQIAENNTLATTANNNALSAQSKADIVSNNVNSLSSRVLSLETTSILTGKLSISTGKNSKLVDSTTTFITNGNQIYIMPFFVTINGSLLPNNEGIVAQFTLPSNIKNVIAGVGEESAETFVSMRNSGALTKFYCDVNTSTGLCTVKCKTTEGTLSYSELAHVPVLFFQQ